jgi:hypothetical protein
VRKRIFIAVLVVAVVGVVAFVFSGPKKGSVEWHKREYLKARDGRGFANRTQQLWSKIRGQSPDFQGIIARTRFHENALIQLGYLEAWKFIVSNQPPRDVTYTIVATHDLNRRECWHVYPQYWGMDFEGANVVIVVGRKGERARWEALVRKADVVGATKPPWY